MTCLNTKEKTIVSKRVSSTAASDMCAFSVNASDSKSVGKAIDDMKTEIARIKCDYEIILVRKR